MSEASTPTETQRQRAAWDLLLADLELRAEQIRQSRQQQTWEPWKVGIAAVTSAAALLGAGAALGALLSRALS